MTDPEAHPTAAASVVVVDFAPRRTRRSLDLVRLAGLVVTLLVLAGLGSVARDTGRGLSEDLTRLVGQTPQLLLRSFSVLGAVAALAVPLSLIVAEMARGRSRRLIEALLTGVAAIGLAVALDQVLQSFGPASLYDALRRVGTSDTQRPLDAYLAALVAFVTVIGLRGSPGRRRSIVAMTALYIVSAFAVTEASLLSLLSSATIGALVGVLVRYVAGQPGHPPDGFRIADELARAGIPLRRLERHPDGATDHRNYVAEARDGSRLTVQALDRDLIASGLVHSIYRLISIQREIAPPPTLSLERVAEQRTLLAMAAVACAAPIPRLLAGVRCGSDTIVLAYEAIVSTALREPTDAQLDELWSGVNRLHRRRITHRWLTAGRIHVDGAGHILLPIPTDGTPFANDLRISLDRAQLLVVCAQLGGAERAVRAAGTVLSKDELTATLPVLQPIALAGETRAAIKRDPHLLEALREEIQGRTDVAMPELARVERVRPRTIISVAALIVAAYVLVGEFGSVHVVSVLAAAHWQWVPLVLLASAATYPAAALSLIGYVTEKVSFIRTTLAQLAASFAGFVTPPSVGGLAVNIRFLQKARLSTTAAATSVGMAQLVNAAVHVVLLVVFAAATGTTSHRSLPVPGWAFIALGIATALVLGALAIPRARRAVGSRAAAAAREALPRLLDLLTSPVKLAEGLLGALLLNAAYMAALWSATLAFNGKVGVASIAVVYLASAAIGSIAPTPGGLGAVEIALATGLAAAGTPSAAAVSAVLLYRLATFWLPVPIGWVALHWLQRRQAI